MSHRPCPQCRIMNPATNPYCARCGASFYRQTIVYGQDADAPYWIEMEARPAAANQPLGRAVAVFAAEVALGYMERRIWPGHPSDAAPRSARGRAWIALAGAAVLLAEQALAVRAR